MNILRLSEDVSGPRTYKLKSSLKQLKLSTPKCCINVFAPLGSVPSVVMCFYELQTDGHRPTFDVIMINEEQL